MDHPELDDLFAQIALKHRFINQEQLNDCRMALQAISSVGVRRSLQDIMIDKGYLTKEEVLTILRYLVTEGERPQLGNFEILGKVGEGGMGAVYKARQLSLDRVVALKVLPPSLAKDNVFVRRFIREAKTAAKLSHPNIITVLDVGESDGFHFIAMEFIDGMTVDERVQQYSVFPEQEALSVGASVAAGLAYAARYHIVHRDIKPANIMITNDGSVKLCDLGLAKQTFLDDASVTESGATIGTPLYMSPEQARGQVHIDSRSDIYSLGATLFFMMTGQPPFRGRTPLELLRKRLEEPPPWAADLNPAVSEWSCQVIQRMMATNADDRLQTHDEVYNVLASGGRGIAGGMVARVVQAVSSDAISPSVRGRRKRKRMLNIVTALGTAAVIGLVLGILFIVGRERGTGPANAVAPPRAARPVSPAPPTQTPGTHSGGTVATRGPDRRPPSARQPSHPSANQLFASLAAEAEKLVKENKFGAAIETLSKVPTSKTGQANRLIAGYEKAALQEFEQGQKRAEELCKQGKFEDAERAVLAMKGFGIPKISDLVDKERAKISELREQHKLAERQAAKAEYRQIAAMILEMSAKGEFEQAIQECDKALKDKKLRPLTRNWLQTHKKGIQMAQGLLAGAEARGKELIGQPFAVRGIKGKIVKIEDGIITIDASGVELSKPLIELKPEEFLKLALNPGEADTANSLMKQGVYLLYRGEVEPAMASLAAAREKGAKVEQFMETLALLDTAVRDSKIEELFEKGNTLFEQEKYPEAAEVFGKLADEYTDLESFLPIKKKVDRLRALAELRIGAMDDMVLIRGGKFIYQKGEERTLPAFYIDRHEVTNAEYRKFYEYIAKTGDHSFCYPNEPAGKDHKPLSFDDPELSKEDHPVVGVDWYDAYAYCACKGKRLPTELEWEKAARGEKGLIYPWGNERADKYWVSGSDADGYEYTAPIREFEEGKSPFGCLHMLGNAAEWTMDWFDGLELNRVARGGGWMKRAVGEPITNTFRMRVEPTLREKDIGFRSAKTP